MWNARRWKPSLDGLDSGALRVAEKVGGEWKVHEWLKKAVLLSFRLNDMKLISGAPDEAVWWDKVDSKFLGWDEARFRAAGFRAVPGAVVRRSAFIAKGAVLMPSFVNVGARVGEGTMIDTWATVGSCAQVGSHCHISGGAGLGGVLEPLQASPTIIEDNCFIGARAEVAEGVIVGEGSVLSMGVYLSASTKIVDRASGEMHLGKVPPYSVVVSGSLPSSSGPIALLRRHCEAGGRKDPRQNLNQRIAARLMATASIDALALAQALIRWPSVTPKDAGALDVLEAVLKAWALSPIACPLATWTISMPGCGDGAPHFCFAGQPMWCRWAKAGRPILLPPKIATGCSMAAAPPT